MPEDFELLSDIMELRRYARAKERVEAAKTKAEHDRLPEWDREWVMRVQEYNIKKHREWLAQQS